MVIWLTLACSLRISSLRSSFARLAKERTEAGRVELVDREGVLGYLADIHGVLASGTVAERRAILKSFVKEVTKGETTATVHYTVPLPPETLRGDEGVLDIVSFGGSNATFAKPGAQTTFEVSVY